MLQIDIIARALTGIVTLGFIIAGIFDVLDYFMVKLLLFTVFISLVVYLFITLYNNETHHQA